MGVLNKTIIALSGGIFSWLLLIQNLAALKKQSRQRKKKSQKPYCSSILSLFQAVWKKETHVYPPFSGQSWKQQNITEWANNCFFPLFFNVSGFTLQEFILWDDEPCPLQKHTMRAGETKPMWKLSSSSMWQPLMINPAPTFIQLNADFTRQLSLPLVWPPLLHVGLSLCGPHACQPWKHDVIDRERKNGNVSHLKKSSWLVFVGSNTFHISSSNIQIWAHPARTSNWKVGNECSHSSWFCCGTGLLLYMVAGKRCSSRQRFFPLRWQKIRVV